MSIFLIALFIGVSVVLFVLLMLSQRRSAAMTRTAEAAAQTVAATAQAALQVKEDLSRLTSELGGRYQELMTQRQAQVTELREDRVSMRDLSTKWEQRITTINESLDRISKDTAERVSDMAGSLKPIVSIFRSPQVAGIEFGETTLELLLKTHLGEQGYIRKPRHLGMGQDVVDFAIKLPDCLVPVDSKFPSTQYRAWVDATNEADAKTAWRAFRDQMLRQMEVTAKYIKPDAGTTDYALIFMPSEIIYQQAFLTQKVHDMENPIPQRALQLQVFGCSTQSLFPMLSLIRLGFRNLKIAEDVKGIRSQIDELNNVFAKVFLDTDWKILRTHIKQLTDHVDRMGSDKGSVSRIAEAVKRLADFSHEHGELGKAGIPASSDDLLTLSKEVSS